VENNLISHKSVSLLEIRSLCFIDLIKTHSLATKICLWFWLFNFTLAVNKPYEKLVS